MKKRFSLAMALCLCWIAAYALADAVPMTKYQPGQIVDRGVEARFMAGCEFENGAYFMLVDSDFNDGYLEVNLNWYYNDSISGGLPVPDGASAEVSAQDEEHCTVSIHNGNETWIYDFAYEQSEENRKEWILKRYEVRRGEDYCFTAELSLQRMDMTEMNAGKTERAFVYYQFFRQANNLNHDKHPASIAEGLVMQEQYPVAAVSPNDPTTRVNLREGPGTKYPRCGSLYSGAMLAIREIKDGWAKIYVGDTDAYINTDFLTFGAAIESVPDMRPTATLRDGEWIEVSRAPYRGGGGTVFQQPGGQEVRIIGEYNNQWRIVDAMPGSYYVHVDDLR